MKNIHNHANLPHFVHNQGDDMLSFSSENLDPVISCRVLQLDFLTLELPETKIAEFVNSVDLDEVAHNEPPLLDLHCLPYRL